MNLSIKSVMELAKSLGVKVKRDSEWQEIIVLPNTPQSEHFSYDPSFMEPEDKQATLEEVVHAIHRVAGQSELSDPLGCPVMEAIEQISESMAVAVMAAIADDFEAYQSGELNIIDALDLAYLSLYPNGLKLPYKPDLMLAKLTINRPDEVTESINDLLERDYPESEITSADIVWNYIEMTAADTVQI